MRWFGRSEKKPVSGPLNCPVSPFPKKGDRERMLAIVELAEMIGCHPCEVLESDADCFTSLEAMRVDAEARFAKARTTVMRDNLALFSASERS